MPSDNVSLICMIILITKFHNLWTDGWKIEFLVKVWPVTFDHGHICPQTTPLILNLMYNGFPELNMNKSAWPAQGLSWNCGIMASEAEEKEEMHTLDIQSFNVSPTCTCKHFVKHGDYLFSLSTWHRTLLDHHLETFVLLFSFSLFFSPMLWVKRKTSKLYICLIQILIQVMLINHLWTKQPLRANFNCFIYQLVILQHHNTCITCPSYAIN